MAPRIGTTRLTLAALPDSLIRRAALAATALTMLAGAVGVIAWSTMATLRVDSNPPGADVFADGNHVGRTPLLLNTMGSATWHVRVIAPGHAPWETDAQLHPRNTTQLFASLVAFPGTLVLETDPPGAAAVLDSEDVGQTPITIDNVAAGVHHLQLSLDDYADWNGAVRIAPGATATQRVAMGPLPARLTISTQVPAAAVLVDGTPRGGPEAEIELEPGQRVIRIEADGYRPWQRMVELGPNERRTLEVDLQRPWPDVADGDSISPLAVVVENEEHARPQSGLDRADVVYEALAEGGITRFLAIFATQEPDVVGPVRSARDYFVEWAHEYRAPLVHIGASPQGFAALAATQTPDLDEARGHPGFWRTKDRAAPHNAYTSVGGARAALGAKAEEAGTFSGLLYKGNSLKKAGDLEGEATISFGRADYTASWSYDPVSNEYLRSMNGAPHLDAQSGEQLRASNVLIAWVDSWLIPGDSAGRLQFAQVGSGRLVALVDGVAVEGTWTKDSFDSSTTYKTLDGTPLTLNAGTTWIEVIPATGRLSFG